jgi:hypothetical protein
MIWHNTMVEMCWWKIQILNCIHWNWNLLDLCQLAWLKINQHPNYNHAMKLHLTLCSHSIMSFPFELSFCSIWFCFLLLYLKPNFCLSLNPCSLSNCGFLQVNWPWLLHVGNFNFFICGVQIFVIYF